MLGESRVKRIEPTKVVTPIIPTKIRVAAYCRVSTDNDAQLDSLENQIEGFQMRLAKHTDWELVKIYADEGISGTSAKKRPQFMEMMRACKEGKIDRIITKSISRFARNTLDCLTYVRELKAYGVSIIFEKEDLDTANSISEMMLSIMASFAQEESRSISENLKWGVRKRFEEGIEPRMPLYGYRHSEKESFQVVPEEARIVREIYERYVHGEDTLPILNDIVRRRIVPPSGGKWNRLQLDRMLTNEKYAGDSVMQKTFVVDHLTHRQVKNRGDIPMFYLENAHAAIIDKHVFEQAQEIRKMKCIMNGNPTYPYGEMLKCPHCGKILVQGTLINFYLNGRTIQNGGWGCYGEGGCASFLLMRNVLDEALLKAYEIKFFEKKKSVEYYWLDDTIEKITLTDETVTIKWKDGTESREKLNYPKKELKPKAFAATYNAYLDRMRRGEIKTRKKNLMGLDMKEAK